MHRQVARWETPSEDTLTQSTQLHSHQMEGTLCPALLIGQFNFGMHRYVDRWETPSKGTLPQSSQLHFHQMKGTLCQVQMIGQFHVGMHKQMAQQKLFFKMNVQMQTHFCCTPTNSLFIFNWPCTIQCPESFPWFVQCDWGLQRPGLFTGWWLDCWSKSKAFIMDSFLLLFIPPLHPLDKINYSKRCSSAWFEQNGSWFCLVQVLFA